ncbi:MAG TPA: OB-fold domain-containing protein [Xanthomonadales bacterium]|nr:OB-fold domain-containing protein [Xanthomonadales bacterium]
MILPLPDEATRQFWQGTSQRILLLRHCLTCQRWLHPQLTECGCGGKQKLEWREASGDGILVAHTEVQYMPVPALRSMVPFTLLLVRTEEGPQLVSSVSGTGHALSAGMRLKAVYDEVGSGISLIRFVPVENG